MITRVEILVFECSRPGKSWATVTIHWADKNVFVGVESFPQGHWEDPGEKQKRSNPCWCSCQCGVSVSSSGDLRSSQVNCNKSVIMHNRLRFAKVGVYRAVLQIKVVANISLAIGKRTRSKIECSLYFTLFYFLKAIKTNAC